ncbi:glucose N-acetyltransferase [Paraphoma chrysanthemicola]|nr:glucose N-acetyltransferase [Paraphoma chrysanthemicola]
MLERLASLWQYSPLRSYDDSEYPKSNSGRYLEWFALRRVRTALAALTALILFLSLTFIFHVPARLHPQNDAPPIKIPDPSLIINWNDFAYVQYVTNGNYLCNSLMILEALHRHRTKADRIMMYPEDWKVPGVGEHLTDVSIESRLLAKARDFYGTKLVPVKLQTFARGDPKWKDSYTKLLAFNQTQYKRLISLDSDATVRDYMDELFLSSSAPVAMPRAYWLDQPFLSSQLILLEPSEREWYRIEEFMNRDDPGFDMDILNTLYKDSCLILPHRRYNIITGELRGSDHSKYLGTTTEKWNGSRIFQEAKFVHFSDWPVPKPWLKAPDALREEHQPKCVESEGGQVPDCTDRDLWLGLYADFSERRQVS